jgi:PAS domain S-box-containing protein
MLKIDQEITLLLVEDNKGDANLFKEFIKSFKKFSIKHKHVETLRETLEEVKNSQYDLILLDLNLPDSGGIDTFLKLTAVCSIPIIVLTGLNDQELGEAIINMGGQDYLTKGTFDELSFKKTIESSINRNNFIQEIEKREAKFKSIIENNADGMIVLDNDGIVKYINPVAEKLLNLEHETIIGNNVGIPIVGGELTDIEVLGKGNKIITIQMRVIPTEWDNKEVFIASLRDITEQKESELAIKNNEIKYRQLFNDDLTGNFITTVEGKILLCNPAMAAILGFNSVEELMKENITSFYKKTDSREEFVAILREKKKIERFEREFICRDGKVIHAIENVVGEFDENGELIAMKGYLFDNTERKLAEQALQKNEAFTRSILDNLPVGVAVNTVIPDVTFTYMNDNFLKIYRTSREKLSTPNSFWNAAYEDALFREEIKKRIVDDCASGDLERMSWEDIPITRKGEETTFISAKNIPLPDENLMISTVWDITERKRMEEARNESEANYLALYNSIRDAILVANSERQIIDCNPAFTSIFGYSLNEIKNKKTISIYENEEQFNELGIALKEHSNDETPFLYTVNYKKKDGLVFPGETSVYFLKNLNGKVSGFIGLIRDVTERKISEEALHNKMNELERFHDVTVGREFVMIDLKKEVNELLKILGMEEKYRIVE